MNSVTCKKQTGLPALTVRPYESRDKAAFDALNRAWLTKYFAVEPIDEVIFADPEGKILKPGGAIFIAEAEGRAVGVGALILHESGDRPIYELSKMGVNESIQGRGIGRQIIEAALRYAEARNSPKIIIYSNTKLAPAIGLYKKMGFVETPLSDEARARYKRCDITLEKTFR